jgi:hypothetical protein
MILIKIHFVVSILFLISILFKSYINEFLSINYINKLPHTIIISCSYASSFVHGLGKGAAGARVHGGGGVLHSGGLGGFCTAGVWGRDLVGEGLSR